MQPASWAPPTPATIARAISAARAEVQSPTFARFARFAVARRRRHWKASTAYVTDSYLRTQLLPYFAKMRISAIARRDVRRWFAGQHATPAAANRALPILSGIFDAAIVAGYRESNPCRGLRKYPARPRKRYLSDAEIRRLGAVLAAHQGGQPVLAALVRLLLLTGARQGELRRLRWADYRDGHLHLPDAKAGPRTVWLHAAARQVLDDLPCTSSWVFPSSRGGETSNTALYDFWLDVRADAGLEDGVRLHDLRHTYASFALRRGESILAVGKLLGHRDKMTTMGYSHFDDGLALQAAQRVADRL